MIQTADLRAITNASSTAFVVAAMFLLVPAVVIIQLGAPPLDAFSLLRLSPFVLPPLVLIAAAISLRAFRRGDERHLMTALRFVRIYVILQLAFVLLVMAIIGAAYAGVTL